MGNKAISRGAASSSEMDTDEVRMIGIEGVEGDGETTTARAVFDGMETRVRDVISSLEIGIDDEVRMIGIKGMGGSGKTALARAVFDHLHNDFEAKSFIENVRQVSNTSMFGLKPLQERVLSDVLNKHVTVNGVNEGKKMMKEKMCNKKVLLVLDDVSHIEQLEALAGEPDWFKPGSRIIITTRDEQVLVAHRVKMILDIALLSEQEAISLFSRFAFGRENPVQGYEELSGKVVRYAAGLPLTLKVLGSFLYGKDKDEWVDAIDRLKELPLKDTMEKLELSYISLEDDYKEMFLDIACILKGECREYAIRVLECCGFHAKNALKVLEQRSLITVDEDGFLGMHDHIEEMGKNIVRRSHPDEPNKHSRLWIREEIEDILANDMGTQETRCLKLDKLSGNARIVMKGLGKMKKLQYLEVNFAYYDSETDCESDVECLDDTTQYFPNSLKYLKCKDYPFLYLPRTFQANNLVGLEMKRSRMVQLWGEGEKKVIKKLKFLSLSESNLTTFDFRITPNLETLILRSSDKLVELCCPVSYQKLKHLHISDSKLTTFDLGLTPNLETLSLENCADFVELHVSAACPNLKFLDLPGSRLRSLDLELVPNLERLNLAGCDKLVEINLLDSICMLESLGMLDLSATRIKHLPHSICLLKCLKYLILDHCALLEKLPEDLGRLECLERLHVRSKKIEYLPDSLCMLKRLRRLDVTNCSCLGKLPEDIGQLESLERLYLSATKIKYLPDSICMLKHLNYLNLEDCALLEKLPEDLGRLECLEELVITNTGISHLPQSIFGLKGLLITASSELLELYDFPSEIKTTTGTKQGSS